MARLQARLRIVLPYFASSESVTVTPQCSLDESDSLAVHVLAEPVRVRHWQLPS